VKEHWDEPTKLVMDAASAGIAIGALIDLLPSIAALLTIIWTLIRITESDAYQRWVARVQERTEGLRRWLRAIRDSMRGE